MAQRADDASNDDADKALLSDKGWKDVDNAVHNSDVQRVKDCQMDLDNLLLFVRVPTDYGLAESF